MLNYAKMNSKFTKRWLDFRYLSIAFKYQSLDILRAISGETATPNHQNTASIICRGVAVIE